jgi:hypothetical protein
MLKGRCNAEGWAEDANELAFPRGIIDTNGADGIRNAIIPVLHNPAGNPRVFVDLGRPRKACDSRRRQLTLPFLSSLTSNIGDSPECNFLDLSAILGDA